MARLSAPLRVTRATPIYNIGAVSRLCGLPIYTLRWIERHGLVAPTRTEGNQRLFSEEDLELLHMIRDLMEERVNLAGIRVILKMRVEIGEIDSAAVKAAVRGGLAPVGRVRGPSSQSRGER